MPTTQDLISANLSTLEEFDNPSAEALYKKIAQSVGDNIDLTLREFSNSENRILKIINDQRYGRSGYYEAAALAFQFGDDLVVDPVTFDDVYSVIDPSKQIIAQAAFEEIVSGSSSELFLKVAKLDPLQNILVQLSQDEQAEFADYYKNFEIPGLPIGIVALPANLLGFSSVATYFKTYNLATLKTNLAQALINFRNTFQFNGEFFNGDLQDYLKQTVPGMRDFFISSTTIDGEPFSGAISLTAGYFNFIAGILDLITYSAV